MTRRDPNPPAHRAAPEAASHAAHEGAQEAARRVDPAAIVAGFDARHDHLELRRAGEVLSGQVDLVHAGAVRAWAAEQGLDARIGEVVPEPVAAAVSVRLRSGPSDAATAVSEVRLGEPVERVARDGAWSKVRTGPDRYLGWIRDDRLTSAGWEADHRVTMLRSHAYAAPRVQGEVLAPLAWGDRLRVRTEGDAFCEAVLPDGRTAFVPAATLSPLGEEPKVEPLDGWRPFLGTPYLWGGGSAWGVDCSALIQLLFRRSGREIPRDADEQYAAGARVDEPEPGDLVCMRGHVGLYLGHGRMAHASGRTMQVVETPVVQEPKDQERFLGYVRLA